MGGCHWRWGEREPEGTGARVTRHPSARREESRKYGVGPYESGIVIALTIVGEIKGIDKAGRFESGLNRRIEGGELRGKGVEGRKVEAVDGEEIKAKGQPEREELWARASMEDDWQRCR